MIPAISFRRKTPFFRFFLFLLSVFLFACGGSQDAANPGGERKNESDFIPASEGPGGQPSVTLTGRGVKGIVQHAQVSAFGVQSGLPSEEIIGSSITDEEGRFSIRIARWKFQKLAYLEISADTSSQFPSMMLCDAYSGCGLQNDLMVGYGDYFRLSPSFLMRNVATLKGVENSFIGNFSPLRHAAVARAEAKSGGLSWSNIKEAEGELGNLLLFSKPLRELVPVNLLSAAETAAASDEQVVLAILESAFLNIGVSPNYVAVEELLSRVTTLGGQFQSDITSDLYRLSLRNLLRAAYHNIPDSVAHRSGIQSHLLRIIDARVPGLALELVGSQPQNNSADEFALQLLSNDGGQIKVLPLDELCATGCEYLAVEGTPFSLSLIPEDGYEFSHWEGDCAESSGSCDLFMDRAKTASAIFILSQADPTFYSLDLNISGAGQVLEQDSIIRCLGEGCNVLLEEGQQIVLVATASDGYQFDGWSGDCSGTGNCELSINGDKSVTAQFSPILVTLTLELRGAGSVSATTGWSCSSSPCQLSVAMGETVNLTANPLSGFQFKSWGGACSGVLGCAVTMNTNTRVVANFTPIMHKVTVTASGDGSITSADKSVACSGARCIYYFAEGTTLSLLSLAESGFQFDGWFGACSGTGSCLLEIKQDISVQANFSPVFHTLSVSVSEGGSAFSLAADLNCSASVCSTQVLDGGNVTLSAQASEGYQFDGWSGACSGTGNCELSINGNKAVTAQFSPALLQLTLELRGAGSVSSPTGWSCSSSPCQLSVAMGETVNLTANPLSGFQFKSW
ncbi:MAG: InlB B-repeat-containing protein, partial [Pseudomonadales bacterium]|nr:InlB B-repeat-containing protein [Pseudomonadales bacterium]